MIPAINAGRSLTTLAKRYVFSEIEGSLNAFCWGVCYAPGTDVGTIAVDLASGETNDEFSGHLYNNMNNSGESFIMYTIFDESNPDDSVAVVVDYRIGQTKVPDLPRKSGVDFSVYPNPATSVCYIRTSAANYKLKVFDIIGNLVYENNVAHGSRILDISDLQPGLYNVLIVTDTGKQSKILVKE